MEKSCAEACPKIVAVRSLLETAGKKRHTYAKLQAIGIWTDELYKLYDKSAECDGPQQINTTEVRVVNSFRDIFRRNIEVRPVYICGLSFTPENRHSPTDPGPENE